MGVCSDLRTKQCCACAGRWKLCVSSFYIYTVFGIGIQSLVYGLCMFQVNNAGCMVNQRDLTEEGLEKNFATNTLGKMNLNFSLT